MKTTLNCITQPRRLNEFGKDMLPEEYLIYCARVSSAKRKNLKTAPALMRYLINSGHWSPFEMISIGIEVETSRAIAQQILRHRSFSFQEFSQRYAEVDELEPMELRKKAETNRQSSTDLVQNKEAIRIAKRIMEDSMLGYKELVRLGVATECARFILPLTTKTTIVMHATLRSWIHFFNQRCSGHAQLEIQQLAYSARNIIIEECPWTAEALEWDHV